MSNELDVVAALEDIVTQFSSFAEFKSFSSRLYARWNKNRYSLEGYYSPTDQWSRLESEEFSRQYRTAQQDRKS